MSLMWQFFKYKFHVDNEKFAVQSSLNLPPNLSLIANMYIPYVCYI